MLSFPDIDPEIFSINVLGFEFVLRWYAVSYIVGFVCAIFLMKFFIRRSFLWKNNKAPMTEENAESLLTFLIFGVILGGRLGYVIFYNLDFYLLNPTDIIRVWDGGMSFHGGFLGVVLAVLLYCRIYSIAILSTADLVALGTPPGLFFGRIANFINAELWGRPTDVKWGVIFPGERAQQCDDIVGPCARHPSQLYEAGLEGPLLLLILLLLTFYGALKRPALVTGIFLIGYGLSRFTVEFYREPDDQFFSDLNPYGYAYTFGEFGLTMGQVLSLPMVFSGILLMILSFLLVKKRHENY